MKKSGFLIILIAIVHFAVAQSIRKALVGGYLINSEGSQPIQDGTILIRDTMIEKVGPRKRVKIPPGTEIIDLKGKYIIPGLIDGHIHFFQSGGLYTRPDALDLTAHYSYEKEQAFIKSNIEGTLARYLRAGITGVADVGGGMWNFEVRQLALQTEISPRVIVAGPLISTIDRVKLDIGDPPIIKVSSEDEVDSLVQKMVIAKADLIKIWFIAFDEFDFEANLQLVKRTIDRSHAGGIRVAVHATQLRTAKESVKAGADILVHSVDDKEVDKEFIQLLNENGTIYTSSLSVLEGFDKIISQDISLSSADYAIADPFVVNSLMDLQHISVELLPDRLKEWLAQPELFLERSRKRQDIASGNLKILQDAGVTIATGTDAGNPGTFHGSSIFREFELMKNAGLTPQQIVVNSTLNGARLMGSEQQTGSIEVGKLADLVVLNSNPLEEIGNFSDITFVVKDGIIYYPDEIITASPEEIVQRQVVAYNQRDLEKFLSFFAEDVKIFNHPNEIIMDGKIAVSERYGNLFERADNLHVEVVNRITLGNRVIDQESVTGINEGLVRAIAIYEVTDGLIQNVWFIRNN